jgi:c(7)-type cytochrome triheme protein
MSPRRDQSFARILVAAAAGSLLLLPVLALAIPATVRIPRRADHRSFAPAAVAQFSHAAHQPLRCFQCHPAVFPQAPLAFDHAAMDAGRFCGSCHEGQRAPAVASYSCESCHVPVH